MKASILAMLALIFALASAEYAPFGSTAFINDNNVLQYALTLENLEAAFYQNGLTQFNASAFAAAGFNTSVRIFLLTIRDHELAHVAALTQLLTLRGAIPVTACNYTFPYTNVIQFLGIAAALEATGTSAYDGAIASFTQTDLITLAAGVATVEARHSAYLNVLTGGVPFPNATDIALGQLGIFGIAQPFFNGACASLTSVTTPANFILPASMFRNSSLLNQTVFNQTAAYINDNNFLQYVLTLEYLEATFYATALSNISANVMTAQGISALDQTYIHLIGLQEAAHAAAISSLLIARNAIPVTACPYTNINFTNDAAGLNGFFTTAVALETVGVSAYIGAMTFLSDERLIAYAATIATVEGRHTSYLKALVASRTNDAVNAPFPNIVDPGYNVSAVIAAASNFLNPATCITFNAPISADTFRPNQTLTASATATAATSATATASTTATATATTTAANTTATTSGSMSTNTTSSTNTASTGSTRTGTGTTTRTASDSSVIVVSAGVFLAAMALVC